MKVQVILKSFDGKSSIFFLFPVDLAKDIEDDLIKQIDIATSTPPTSKLPENIEKSAQLQEPAANGTNGKKEQTEDKDLNDSLTSVDDETSTLGGRDAEVDLQNEDDLLKDLDDDHEDDIGKEMEDLLEYALEKEDKEEKSSKATTEVEKSVDELPANEIPAVIEDDDAIDEVKEKIDEPTEKESKVDLIQDDVLNTDDLIEEVDPKESATDKPPSIEEETANQSEDKDTDAKIDDLLVACESPPLPTRLEQDQTDDISDSSSNVEDTPEESSDGEKNNEKSDEPETTEADKTEADIADVDMTEVNNKEAPEIENMDVDEMLPNEKYPIEIDNREADAGADDTDDEHLCIVTDQEPSAEPAFTLQSEAPKESEPFKLNFIRKFSSAVGKLSRPELEELLIEKITESLMFCSENTDLRSRLEKEEKISDAFKKRLENVKKQYNDLEMIHNRVMKDLKERPDAPITPVKITRAVGLQVFQPINRLITKPLISTPPNQQALFKPTNKRPMEVESTSSGKGTFAENAKRKKSLKITPMRPPLSDKERASIDLQEAKEEQKLRTNVGKNVIGSNSSNVTMTPLNATNGITSKTMSNSDSIKPSQSIDLTDDLDDSSTSTVAKVPSQPVQTPPALVAIRGTNQGQPTAQQRTYVLKTSAVVANSRPFQFKSKSKLIGSRQGRA